MSIVRMRKVFRRRMKAKIGKKHLPLPSPAEAIFYLIIVIFVAGAYYTFGGPGSSGRGQQAAGGRVTPVVARVNGEKIPRALYDLNIMHQERDESDPTQARWLRASTLNGLVDAFLMRQAAKTEGIKVTGADLKKKIDEDVERTLSMKFPDPRSLRRYLKKQEQTLEQYKAQLRQEISADKDSLREAVAQEKLKQKIEDRVALTDEELKDSYTEVRASHILIDPKKEAEAAQAKAGANAPAQAVDGDALAKKRAEDLLAKIKAGGDFAQLAKENSTCPSASKGGDLDWFKRGMMAREFEEAAFKLQVGQTSEVVKSPFGYHIIKVTGRRSELPKDFEQNKATYREQVLAERKYRAWAEYRDNLRKQAEINIEDPELLAYSLLDEAMKGGTPDKAAQARAKEELARAVEMNPGNVTAIWELASLFEEEGNVQRALDLVQQAALQEAGARSPQVHIKLGELYESQKQKDKAIAEYKDAFDRASAFTMMNYGANMQVERKLKALGREDLAKQVTQWLDDYRKEQAKNPMGGMGGFGPMGGMPITIPER